MKKLKTTQNRDAGFSLVEVVIAIGVVALLITAFLAVFGPAQKNIANSLSVKDVNRLSSTLETEMAILREGETYPTAFDKAFQWIKNSGDPAKAVLVYQYKAHPTDQNDDGTLRAYDPQTSDGIPGKDFVIQTVVRVLGDDIDKDYMEDELVPGVVNGAVYALRLTQLIHDAGSLKTGTLGVIQGSAGPADTSDAYDQAVIAFQAEFFRLKSNQKEYVKGGTWNFESLGSPLTTRNMAVRR